MKNYFHTVPNIIAIFYSDSNFTLSRSELITSPLCKFTLIEVT